MATWDSGLIFHPVVARSFFSSSSEECFRFLASSLLASFCFTIATFSSSFLSSISRISFLASLTLVRFIPFLILATNWVLSMSWRGLGFVVPRRSSSIRTWSFNISKDDVPLSLLTTVRLFSCSWREHGHELPLLRGVGVLPIKSYIQRCMSPWNSIGNGRIGQLDDPWDTINVFSMCTVRGECVRDGSRCGRVIEILVALEESRELRLVLV